MEFHFSLRGIDIPYLGSAQFEEFFSSAKDSHAIGVYSFPLGDGSSEVLGYWDGSCLKWEGNWELERQRRDT